MARNVIFLVSVIWMVSACIATPVNHEQDLVAKREQESREFKEEIKKEIDKYLFYQCNEKLMEELTSSYFNALDKNKEEDNALRASMFFNIMVVPADKKLLDALIERLAGYKSLDLPGQVEVLRYLGTRVF